jgi:large subunit ribosomal protein L20
MTRATSSPARKKFQKKIFKLAKGFRGRAKNCYRVTVERVEKSLQYSYRDRKVRRRDFRKLWILRINAAVRQYDMIYSQFIHGLKLINNPLDRKSLAELAVHEPEAFKSIVDSVKTAINS